MRITGGRLHSTAGVEAGSGDEAFHRVLPFLYRLTLGEGAQVPLPEIADPQRASVRGGHAFECSNSFGKIRRFCQRCGKNVTMIRHEAMGENGETMTAKLPGELARQQLDETWIGEELATLACANR